MTTTTLSPMLRALIDERLDGIDRVLRQARTPRAERLEILESVENQAMEMLSQRAADAPTRRDVLTVLAELDPPEAYALREDRRAPEFAEPQSACEPTPSGATPTAKWSMLAVLAGVGVPVWLVGAVSTVALAFLAGEAAEWILIGGIAFGVIAAFANAGLGVYTMVKIAQSKGALKGMLFAAAGATVPLLLLFHCMATYMCAVLAFGGETAMGLVVWLPYVVSLPLPVAWALFERFRHRECAPTPERSATS